ncbi:MAG: hypothetical protein PW791_13845 [Neorhizobium sp.]|jgi:predicted chitinase|nr:hypothetical protein [Neorhizobium sp.]
MAHDRDFFFASLRQSLFAGHLSPAQVEGLTAILDGYERHRTKVSSTVPEAVSRNRLAYIFATAYHETARRMQPVRETLAASDAEAIAILDRAYRNGRLGSVKSPYWRRDSAGRTWLGRGFVQLTHRRNYTALSALTGVDLVEDPARAMEMATAVAILVEGMAAGSFTGRRLADDIAEGRCDFIGARKVINGTDRAALVAAYAKAFAAALQG